MGQLRKRAVKRSRPRSHGGPATPLNRWLSAGIIATMMAISTVVIAAEIPRQSAPALYSPTGQSESVQSEAIQPEAIRSKPLQLSQRRIRRKDIWQEVQNRLPGLPLENQYVNKDTGEINESNTLVRRMIEYHNFRKGRSPRSRFDWKLTLADYLGLHEVMLAESYPSVRKLTTNPLNGDRAAIQRLDRQQRDQLVNMLVSLYDPRIPSAFFSPPPPVVEPEPAAAPVASPPSVETSPSQSAPPPLSEPGAADLLRPRP